MRREDFKVHSKENNDVYGIADKKEHEKYNFLLFRERYITKMT